MSEIAEIKNRLRALEDQIAIYQIVCGYGYAMDGLNSEVLGSLYAPDGVHVVPDAGGLSKYGREAVAGIAKMPGHIELIGNGCAHTSTLPHVVIDGDRASATCHTIVLKHTDEGFMVWRCSACRIELSRTSDGGWQIDHRQNHLLDGNPAGPQQLARLKEGPSPI